MEIRIPKFGQAMQEGTIARWFVADGESVASGDALYLLETDKVENEIEAPASGVARILAAEGSVLPVGTLIARIEVS
jgi:pyruvate/2-oxoglutarate dehydrogenase complex dihydrolipoamide acyltransferase (E2) component